MKKHTNPNHIAFTSDQITRLDYLKSIGVKPSTYVKIAFDEKFEKEYGKVWDNAGRIREYRKRVKVNKEE